MNVYNVLTKRYGASAMSTYVGARMHGFNCLQSLVLLRMQVKELTISYPGGLECVKFRGKERIQKMLS